MKIGNTHLVMYMEKRIVLIDTNFLMIPYQFKIEIFSEIRHLLDMEYKLAVSSATVRELEYISKGRTKGAIAARVAKKIIDARESKIEVIKTILGADQFIEEFANAKKGIVCTNDMRLRQKIRKSGIKIIALKSKSKIGFIR